LDVVELTQPLAPEPRPRRRVDHQQAERADRERQHQEHEVGVPPRARVGSSCRRGRRHQSMPCWKTCTGGVGRLFIFSMIRRAIGAAVCAPKPACSTTTATTYFGCAAVPPNIPTKSDVSPLPATCAVPVLPAIGTCAN